MGGSASPMRGPMTAASADLGVHPHVREAPTSMGFDRHSMLRQMGDPIVGVLLLRALVMEVAHAKVGAGVRDHSAFTTRPLRRGWATGELGLRMIYGNDRMACQARAQIMSFHDHINGELLDATPTMREGEHYSAHDTSLQLWVWATLVDIIEDAYTRWVRPISEPERASFYADMVSFAMFFGIPAVTIPPNYPAFREYWDDVLDGDELAPTPSSEAVIHDVLHHPAWFLPDFVVRPMRVLSLGTLDPRLSKRLGLPLDVRDQRLFERLDASLVRTYRRVRLEPLILAAPYVYLFLRRPTIGLSKRIPGLRH